MAFGARSGAGSDFTQSNRRASGWASVPASVMWPRMLLIVSTTLLVLIGIVMVYSASTVEAITNGEDATSYVVKQVIFSFIGLACAVVIYRAPAHIVFSSYAVYFVCVVSFLALAAVAVMGVEIYGGKRWLYIGSVSLQPSEFAKIGVMAASCYACLLWKRGEAQVDGLRSGFYPLVVFIVASLFFIFKDESDMGTTGIIVVAIFAMFYMAGVRKRQLAAVVVCLGVLVAVLILLNADGYRLQRIMVWLDPWSDQYGKGYQMIRSFYAFAEGGIFGVGLGNSREKFLYLPEAETDFIFSIIGEELGLVGALVVVALFIVVLWSGLKIAAQAVDEYGRLLAGGLTVMLVCQAFLNMFCAMGVLPTTGKPLPFVSSGGSSVVASLMMVGIILAVSRQAGDTAASIDRTAQRRRKNLTFIHVEDSPSQTSRTGRGGGSRSAGGYSQRSMRTTSAGNSTSRSSRRDDRGSNYEGSRSSALGGGSSSRSRQAPLRLAGDGSRRSSERRNR